MFHEANKIENIISMLNLLEEHFLQEYPFFTLYLPENIKEFEDFIVIMDDGNYCEIIARIPVAAATPIVKYLAPSVAFSNFPNAATTKTPINIRVGAI